MTEDFKKPPLQFSSRESPAVLASFPSLKRGRQEYKIRVIQYSRSGPLLDIREFLVTPTESRFTKKGVSLNVDQVLQLFRKSEEILDAMGVPDELTPENQNSGEGT